MKLVYNITLMLMIPLVAIYIGYGFGTLFTLIPKTNDWKEQLEYQIVKEELSNLVTRTRTLALLGSTTIANIAKDVSLIHSYAVRVWQGGLDVKSNYATWNGVESIQATTPPLDSEGRNFDYSSHHNKFGVYTRLNNASTMNNVWRPIAKSNPTYVTLYMGFEDGLSVWLPYTRLNHFPTLEYTCLKGGNPTPTTGYDPMCRGWYVDAKADPGQLIFTAPYVDVLSTTRNVLISAAQGVFDESGNFVGVVSVDVSMANLEQAITSERILANGYTFMIQKNSEGTIVVHPRYNYEDVKTIFDLEFPGLGDQNTFTPTFQTMLTQSSGQVAVSKGGGVWHLTWEHVTGSDHIICTTVPDGDVRTSTTEIKDKVKKRQDTAIALNVVFLVIMAGIGMGAIYLVSRRIVQPINDLNRVTGALKEGQVDVELNIRSTAPEFSQIGAQFSLLIKAMQFGNRAFLGRNPGKAMQIYQDVAEAMEKVENNYGLGVAWNNMALTYSMMDDKDDEALEYFNRAIDLAGHLYETRDDEDDHSMKKTWANRLMNKGVHYMNTGDYSKGLKLFNKAIKYHEEIGNDLGVLQAIGNKGALLLDNDEHQKAYTMLLTAYQRAQKGFKPKHRQTDYDDQEVVATLAGDIFQYAAMNMGIYWMKMAENESSRRKTSTYYDNAIGHFNEALSAQRSMDSNLKSMCVANLADIYEERGDTDQADRFKALIISNAPKHVLFVLDTSGSMSGGRIKPCRTSIITILENYMHRNDMASLMVFNDRTRWSFKDKNVSENIRDLKAKVNRDTNCDKGTAFYDAVFEAINHVRDMEMSNNDQWIVALTDGEDNRSQHSASQLARAVADNGINIIIITVGSLRNRREIKSITDAAESGRGILISADSTESISEAFGQAAEVINAGHVALENF